MHVDVEQVWVTVGATQALLPGDGADRSAPGDEVLVPDPGYTTFSMNARMLDAVPVPYTLRAETRLPARPRRARDGSSPTAPGRSSSTRPSNPLGTVLPRGGAASGCWTSPRRHDLWVISDEVYECFTYGDAAREHRLASLDADDRVFSVFSLLEDLRA